MSRANPIHVGSPACRPGQAQCAAMTVTPRLKGSRNRSGSAKSLFDQVKKNAQWPVCASNGRRIRPGVGKTARTARSPGQ